MPRDTYAGWLQGRLDHYSDGKSALYSVRKYSKVAKSAWQKSGKLHQIPATTQGSEDFVRSEISRGIKKHGKCLLDHPSIASLRSNKVKSIVLIDDSLGSGDRVSRYINLFLAHPTMKSWWSYGLLHLYILSYARTRQAEDNIIIGLPGSSHNTKKYPSYSKITFDSEYVYEPGMSRRRWGDRWLGIKSLCANCKKIRKEMRFGYGEVMGNLIFYHSVPNNIPGVLHSKNKGWRPLFPHRVVPRWVEDLLKIKAPKVKSKAFVLPSRTEEGVGSR